MTMILVAAVAVLAVALVLALALLMRGRGRAGEQEQFDLLNERLDAAADAQAHAYERLERQLRNDITETARVSRTEQSSGFAHFQQTLAAQFSSMTTVQGGKIDGFAQQLDAVRTVCNSRRNRRAMNRGARSNSSAIRSACNSGTSPRRATGASPKFARPSSSG